MPHPAALLYWAGEGWVGLTYLLSLGQMGKMISTCENRSGPLEPGEDPDALRTDLVTAEVAEV